VTGNDKEEQMPRIALIHATPAAVEPIVAAFAALWPAAALVNILDDSLSKDRARDGVLTQAMIRRFDVLADYAQSLGAEGILFTCSAFGPAIEQVANRLPMPVLKPNEAMFAEALATGRRIGMLATFQPSIPSMEEEFKGEAERAGIEATLYSVFVPGALEALQAGRHEEHVSRIAEVGRKLDDCDAIMLAQFSMAPAAAALRPRVSVPVLTSPSSAVAMLKRKMSSPD
jgi:Asp/Glu/hydantoin racemase